VIWIHRWMNSVGYFADDTKRYLITGRMCRWRNNERGEIAGDFDIIVSAIKHISWYAKFSVVYMYIFQLYFYILHNLLCKFFEENFCEKFASNFLFASCVYYYTITELFCLRISSKIDFRNSNWEIVLSGRAIFRERSTC